MDLADVVEGQKCIKKDEGFYKRLSVRMAAFFIYRILTKLTLSIPLFSEKRSENGGRDAVNTRQESFVTSRVAFVSCLERVFSGFYRGDFDLSTPGIIQLCSSFLDRKTDREMRESMKEKLGSMKTETPEDFQKAVIELLKVQNETREKY